MRKKITTAVISGILFIALIVMLGKYDVQQIGPAGTSVGFATINRKFHNFTGVRMSLYTLTDIFGYLALCICVIFALIGLIQLIRRRSLAKVDRTILCLGAFYVVVLGLYAFFEKVIINYRPIIMPGDTAPEASFPSSHTMLIITVLASAAMVSEQYFDKRKTVASFNFICYVIIVITVLGRLFCGVHWLTDIVGGILLSISLCALFSAALTVFGGRYRGSKAGQVRTGDRSMSKYKVK